MPETPPCLSAKEPRWEKSTDLYYTIDGILCSPFSCPATVIAMPRTRKASWEQFLPMGCRWCAHKYRVAEAAVEKHPAS